MYKAYGLIPMGISLFVTCSLKDERKSCIIIADIRRNLIFTFQDDSSDDMSEKCYKDEK